MFAEQARLLAQLDKENALRQPKASEQEWQFPEATSEMMTLKNLDGREAHIAA